MRRIYRASGPTAIVLSNVLLCTALIWLRQIHPDGNYRTAILMAGNAVAAVLLFSKRLSGRPLLPLAPLPLVALLLWSVCYCITYPLFLYFSSLITLSHLIIAKTVGPTLAVYLSGDWKRNPTSFFDKVWSICPLLCLLLLATLQWSSNETHNGIMAWLIFSVIVVNFATSQWSARIISRQRIVYWGPSRLAALNSTVLFSSLSVSGTLALVPFGWSFVVDSVIMGLLFLAVQGTFVYGLSNTAPLSAGLFVSTSVPISILAEGIASRQVPPMVSLGLGTAYLVLSGLVTLFSAEKKRSTGEAVVATVRPLPRAEGASGPSR
jgi:hypothetical protein